MLIRNDYLKIIDEIRNLEPEALNGYIDNKLVQLKNENPFFIETLYKDINYILKDVDEEGDNDLIFENGDFVFENGDFKLTGYQTRLHDVIIWLHQQITSDIIENMKPSLRLFEEFSEKVESFENNVLNKSSYTVEYKEKLNAVKRSVIEERNENYERANNDTTMNEFYSISEFKVPENEYQLKKLTGEPIFVGFRGTRSSYNGRGTHYLDIPSKVTSKQYDELFAFMITRIDPPYDLEKLINFHLDYYIAKGGDKDRFVKHIKFVVLEYMKFFYNKNTAHIELLEHWIEEHTPKSINTNSMNTNLNGNNNIINVAGGDINQSNVTLTVSENQFKKLKELGVEDAHIQDLKTIIENKSIDKPTMKDKISKWLTPVIISLTAKGLTEALPKVVEFTHHLMP